MSRLAFAGGNAHTVLTFNPKQPAAEKELALDREPRLATKIKVIFVVLSLLQSSYADVVKVERKSTLLKITWKKMHHLFM